MIILFFLLASGDRLLRGFVEVLPRFKSVPGPVEAHDTDQEEDRHPRHQPLSVRSIATMDSAT